MGISIFDSSSATAARSAVKALGVNPQYEVILLQSGNEDPYCCQQTLEPSTIACTTASRRGRLELS